jgi:sulfate permease, SulP family
MAYAEIAGLPAVTGLVAACGALAIYAVLGSSRQLSVGPESTTALMTAAAVAPLAGGDPVRYATLAAGLAIVVGALCLLARVARAGALADLLSALLLVGGWLRPHWPIPLIGMLAATGAVAVSPCSSTASW